MSAARQYSISQLARAAGVPTTTVRYYERVGLVKPEDRSAGNYRLYSEESLRKLKFIRAAQAIGFTLDDIKTLLTLPDSGLATCDVVQTIIEERLAEVDQRLKDLRYVQSVLKRALGKCRQSRRAERCHVLNALREMSRAK